MKVGSLFSGIGGLELGLEMGYGPMDTRWQVEYEEHARLILDQHWPDAEKYQDVRHVGSRNLTPVDLVCGGFPCQPHSKSGKRQSSADERDLWPEFARIIRELGPRWVVAENVAELLSSTDPAFSRDHAGGFFGRVLRDLAALGFDAEWHCYPAASVGAQHERQRVFIVAWNVAHTAGTGRHEQLTAALSADLGHTSRSRDALARFPSWAGGGWEQPCPHTSGFGRHVRGMADGIPLRLDRIARLGNGVVPQQAAVLGRAIRAAETHWRLWGVMPEQIVTPGHFRGTA
ncbi:DNA cytosine methyltransferase [Deinococcus petrolearius]|uniref:DNA (cytosine-5-)-methyltransferase n=1 Tax=Deinococcus petrolearius TaxID=1751295 RepID=A0ABW1DG58_9DEIO